MIYKKSHRDQKCRPYVTKAIENGCNILEVDIQSACGVIVRGHNWRPKLPFLFDCTFEDYLRRVPMGAIVQLDTKEICLTHKERLKFVSSVESIIKKRPDIEFLISANPGFFRKETEKYFHLQKWSSWEKNKEIKTVDL